MERVKGLLNQRKIPVLLLVLLAVSIVLNVHQYLRTIKPWYMYEHERVVHIGRMIQAGMGQAGVTINKGIWLGVEYEFDVSVGVGLWDPYTGASTYDFTFSLYERTLHGEYSHTPIAEKNLTEQKHKDLMGVGARVSLTVTTPSDPGIYVYRVVIEGAYECEFEFPILVTRMAPVLDPIFPIAPGM